MAYPDVEIEKLRVKYKAVVMHGHIYPSLVSAAKASGFTIATIRYKCLSDIHQDCYYVGTRRKAGQTGQLLGVTRHRIL